ncbi:MAG: hypothetical protein ACI31S_01985 [Bacilli bacterium]
MLRNSKPKITHLNEEQMKILNDMHFGKYYDSLYRPIDNINITSFYKSYSCCGGTFDLCINLERCCFCGEEIYPYVKIKTSYDSWWCDNWNIAEFTKDMEDFQKELAEDLKKLRKLGIIS